MVNVVSVSAVLSYFMVVWFRTNAFPEYMTLLNLDNFFFIAEYNKMQEDGYGDNYTSFLYEYFKDFFLVRLLSCPVCVSFWLGVGCELCSSYTGGFLCCPLTLFFYLILNKLF